MKGKVIYQNLGSGFWGIVGDDNKKYRPVNLPKNLQQEGINIEAHVEKASEGVSLFMWGTAVQILDCKAV